MLRVYWPNGEAVLVPDDTPVLTASNFVLVLEETGHLGGALSVDQETYPVAQLAEYDHLDVRVSAHAGVILNDAEQREGFPCYALLEDHGEPAWRRVYLNEMTRTYWTHANVPGRHALSRSGFVASPADAAAWRGDRVLAEDPKSRGKTIEVLVCLASAMPRLPPVEQEWTTFEVTVGDTVQRGLTVRRTWTADGWLADRGVH